MRPAPAQGRAQRRFAAPGYATKVVPSNQLVGVGRECSGRDGGTEGNPLVTYGLYMVSQSGRTNLL